MWFDKGSSFQISPLLEINIGKSIRRLDAQADALATAECIS